MQLVARKTGESWDVFPVMRVLPEGLALPEDGAELPVPGLCPPSTQGGTDAGRQRVRALLH